MKYQITSANVICDLLIKINELLAEGKKPFVTISEANNDRSLAQNKTLHMWIREIAERTGNDIVYEAGRVKIQYFLPVLRTSESDKAKLAIDICEGVFKARGYEALSVALGTSIIASTRVMSVKEFSTALEMMYAKESIHGLTDPESKGYYWR